MKSAKKKIIILEEEKNSQISHRTKKALFTLLTILILIKFNIIVIFYCPLTEELIHLSK